MQYAAPTSVASASWRWGVQADAVPRQRRPDLGVEWEEANCPLCESRQRSIVLQLREVGIALGGPPPAVIRCGNCGLCFTNPRPTPATIGQLYPTVYRPHQPPRRRALRGRRTSWGRRLLARLRQRCPERYGLPKFGQCRLLDFGCGSGSFLKRMHDQGWNVLGLDISQAAVQRVSSELGLPALLGSLPHPQLLPTSFELITMWQSLEHVHRPLEVLQQAYQLLVPGGRLIVAVPNIDSAPFRWFGSCWFALELPRHLVHFSSATLQRMLQRAGFEVVAVRMAWHSSWLQSSSRLAARQRRGPYWLRWLKFRPLCRLLGWYCVLTRQSDCIVLFATKPALGREPAASQPVFVKSRSGADVGGS